MAQFHCKDCEENYYVLDQSYKFQSCEICGCSNGFKKT